MIAVFFVSGKKKQNIKHYIFFLFFHRHNDLALVFCLTNIPAPRRSSPRHDGDEEVTFKCPAVKCHLEPKCRRCFFAGEPPRQQRRPAPLPRLRGPGLEVQGQAHQRQGPGGQGQAGDEGGENNFRSEKHQLFEGNSWRWVVAGLAPDFAHALFLIQ